MQRDTQDKLNVTKWQISEPDRPCTRLQKFGRSVRDTRILRGADVASEHNLVRTIIKLKLKKRDRPPNPRTRYEVKKLQDRAIRNACAVELRNCFAVLEGIHEQADINTKWH